MQKDIKQNIENKELVAVEQAIDKIMLAWADNLCICPDEQIKKYNKNKIFYLRIRSVIIELHLFIESYIEEYIENYFIPQKQRFSSNSKKVKFRELIIKNNKFFFNDKILVLKKIYKSKDKLFFAKITTLNNLRNAFVHGFDLENNKYNFRDKGNIFFQDNIYTLLKEVNEVVEEISEALKILETSNEQEDKFSALIGLALKEKYCK